MLWREDGDEDEDSACFVWTPHCGAAVGLFEIEFEMVVTQG